MFEEGCSAALLSGPKERCKHSLHLGNLHPTPAEEGLDTTHILSVLKMDDRCVESELISTICIHRSS